MCKIAIERERVVQLCLGGRWLHGVWGWRLLQILLHALNRHKSELSPFTYEREVNSVSYNTSG